MSLSEVCAQQHDREQAALRKVILWGLLGSVGVHLVAFALSYLGIWQRPVTAEITPLEIIVAEPTDPVLPEPSPEEPLEPAELGSETFDPEVPSLDAAPASDASAVALDAAPAADIVPVATSESAAPASEPEAAPPP